MHRTVKQYHPATIAAQASGHFDVDSSGVIPGIKLATTYLRGPDYALLSNDNSYGRDDNDTVRAAEETLRQLEEAEATLLFPSGMAAVASVFRAVPNGGRIVLQTDIYHGVTAFAESFCARRGIELERVDVSDADLLRAACEKPADIVWIEVPSNPWLKITDIAVASKLSREAGAFLVVDGTAATPIMTKALSLGADISMHSATKALNGHSDVMAGSLSCLNPESVIWQSIMRDRHDAGAIIGPFEAWLLLRGLRTLPLRVEKMSENALALARFLESRENVDEVWYPGLGSSPGHHIAKRQMRNGFGYLMSILIRGGSLEALGVAGRLELVRRATSLGGVETLAEHRATIEPQSGIPDNLLRLSIGIEHIHDLELDLDRALKTKIF
ncbi:MAG: PLP-dependent transferase [Roseovarius sp.]|nr:PLP-dependent transferase [Roseovarius sp.]